MGHKAWADTDEKRAFLATMQAGYNAVKTVKGAGVTCAKNIPLQKFLDKVRTSWTEKFGTNWDEERLPGVGRGGTELQRLSAAREVSC
jgi:hypothetical protein